MAELRDGNLGDISMEMPVASGDSKNYPERREKGRGGEERGGRGEGDPGQNLGEGSFPGNQVRSMWKRQKDSCQSKDRRPSIWPTCSTQALTKYG